MDRLQRRWDNRSADEWLDQADRFDRMAGQFSCNSHVNSTFAALAAEARTLAIDTPGRTDQTLEEYDWRRIRRLGMEVSRPSDIGYFRVRAAKELSAAGDATDKRVRAVHLEMAERYQALIRKAELAIPARVHVVP